MTFLRSTGLPEVGGPIVNKPMAAAILTLVAAGLLPLLLGHDQYYLGMACISLIFAIATLGWNFVSGFVGAMSIGHAAFFGLGAYVSATLFNAVGLTPWIGIPLGGVVAGIAALLLGLLSFRLSGPYFALTSVAFAEILRLSIQSISTLGPVKVGGSRGLALEIVEPSLASFQFADKEHYYYALLVLLVAALLVTYWINRSRTGYYWAAIRTDTDAAASLGVPVRRYRCIAALISGIITGAAGAMYAHYVGFLDPSRVVGIDLSVQFLIFGMIGGRATVLGPVVGVLLLYPLGEFIRAQAGASSGLHLAIFGLLLVLCVYFFPKGIVGEFDRWRRRRAKSGGRSDA
jgi:branched-chain amino acid transport system permease protein